MTLWLEDMKHSDQGSISCFFFCLSKCDLTGCMKVTQWAGNVKRWDKMPPGFTTQQVVQVKILFWLLIFQREKCWSGQKCGILEKHLTTYWTSKRCRLKYMCLNGLGIGWRKKEGFVACCKDSYLIMVVLPVWFFHSSWCHDLVQNCGVC